jgi:glycosyltransferase involved in cell wall biosynthesis
MRVCMVAYSFYENDNRIMRYSDALVKAGHHVDVIALRSPTQADQETIRGVHVHRIQTRTFPERSGKIAYLRRLLRFFVKSALWLTYQHIRSPYDLIHVHSVPDFEVFAAIIPRLLGCKVILDIHDIVPEFYCSKFSVQRGSTVFKLLVLAERWSIGFSNHVIIANHLWHDRLVGRSVSPGKCSVIMNYPDTSIFSPSAQRLEDGTFLMMYPGTINYHQGLDIAVHAFHRVRKEMPNARFDVYGNGPDRPTLEQLVTTLGMGDCVRVLDAMPMVDIARVMAQADLGVVPKRSDTFGDEAFSTKSLEFMSLGVPLLMSATTIDRYYFNDSVIEFFRSGDEEDLAAKMLALYRDGERRRSLSENGRRFVEPLSWDKRQGEYFEIIRRLVGDRLR